MNVPLSQLHSDTMPAPPSTVRGRKVLFASAHSIVDFSNGASVATLDLLQRLASLGFESQAFCTPKLDFHHEVCFERIVGDLGEPYHITPSVCGVYRARVLYTRRQRVPITVIRLESTRMMSQRPEEGRAVLGFFGKFLEVNRPDAIITYGGDPITQGMIALARRRGIPVVFSIHNFAYPNPRPFANVDYCIVPSEFARRHYRNKVGLECHVLPYPIDWERVRVEGRDPHFVTFVNPALEKGAGAFVRIARELAQRRPEIPILVVESRGDRRTLAACEFDPASCGNVQIMPHTTDPRTFWSLTRIALMPSLWWENQPLVAIEAMINGIPVIGSDRGGIPEALGDCGFTVPLPARLTPVSTIVPEAEEVEPWIETIIRLWDDRALYEEQSARARQEARRWDPERLNPLYAEFFGKVRAQPWAAVLSQHRLVRPPGPIAGRRLPHANALSGGEKARMVHTLHAFGPVFSLPPRESDRRPDEGAVEAPTNGARHAGWSAPPPESPDLVPPEESPRDATDVVPLSFVVCVSDSTLLQDNLLASPCLERGSPHQLMTFLNPPSAAAGLNAGLDRAKHEWVVLVHQDVLLPPGWDRRVMGQIREAERRFGPVGVAGVYGIGDVDDPEASPLAAERIGRVVDRGRMLRDGADLPARVSTLDELLLVVRRDTPLRFDPSLGFHLYGADLCLQAREQGLAVVAIEALCRHNSRSVGLPPAFFDSAKVFGRKWAHKLPIATPCVIFDRQGQVYVVGNTDERSPLARVVGEPVQRLRLTSEAESREAELLPTRVPGRSAAGAGSVRRSSIQRSSP
jgi:glycosyltransferase involved in cell wall biosynthesis